MSNVYTLSLSALTLSENRLSSLSEAILLRIISHLDLKTISSLSQACRLLSRVTRSESLWRKISKALIGPWIHRPHLLSTRLPKSEQPQNPPLPPDWTTDPNCFPVSHFLQSNLLEQSSNIPFHHNRISSWYDFVTKVLISKFHFLGWHISNKAPNCEIFLGTYDIFSGRIILGEVEARNKFVPIHNQPEDPQPLGLPAWVSPDQIDIEPNGRGYTISGAESECRFEIFTPVYVHDPPFAIHPIQSGYAFANVEIKPVDIPKPPTKFYTWADFEFHRGLPKIRHADKIIARRTDVIFHTVSEERPKDLVNSSGDGPERLQSFTLSHGPDRRELFPIEGPIGCDDDQTKGIARGLWVFVASDDDEVHRVEFGKIVVERQANCYRQVRFLRLTGGRPEFIWHVGVYYGRPFPATDLNVALASDFSPSRNPSRVIGEGGWLVGQGRVAQGLQLGLWQCAHIQFINDPDTEINEMNVHQIRVKWRDNENIEKVTNYYKVQFDQ